MTGFAKSVILRLDYTNYHSWRSEVVRNLKIANCAHHIGRDGGIASALDALMYEEPTLHVCQPGDVNTAIITEAAARQRNEYQVELAAWQHGCDIRKKQRAYDGVAVANAIASTCSDVIWRLVDREQNNRKTDWQPYQLWVFLEQITRAALTPARQHLEEKMSMARQGANESIDIYIDRIERMHGELCMISAEVPKSLTLKFVNSVLPEYAMVATMVKNILHTAYAEKPESDRWNYVVGAFREAEQEHVRLASDVQHGYSAVPTRPRSGNTARGFNNYGREAIQSDASTSAPPAVKRCNNCGSKDHFQYHCDQPLQQPSYLHRTRGGRGGRFGRGGGRGGGYRTDNAMASYVNASQQELLDTIDSLSAQLAASQSVCRAL